MSLIIIFYLNDKIGITIVLLFYVLKHLTVIKNNSNLNKNRNNDFFYDLYF